MPNRKSSECSKIVKHVVAEKVILKEKIRIRNSVRDLNF